MTAEEAKGLVRVTAPEGVQLEGPEGVFVQYEQGALISVDSDTGRELFQKGVARPEEARPAGAPFGVEKR